MSLTYTNLDTALQNMIGSRANIKADSNTRYETFDRVLDDLSLEANWKFAIRRTTLDYLRDVDAYSLTNYLGLSDFKAPYELGGLPFLEDRSFYPQRRKKVRRKSNLTADSTFQRLSTEYVDGEHYLLVNIADGQSFQIDALENLSSDGAWSAVGDGSSLAVDENEYEQGAGSLKFRGTVAGGNNYAGIQNTTKTAIDLSDYEDRAYFLLRVYLPTITDFTSVTLFWGSDTSNYWYKTVTAPLNKTAFITGWQQLAFRWEDASSSGSPDDENVDYFEIRFNYATGFADNQLFRADDLRINERVQLEFDYFSRYLVKSAAGEWKKSFSTGTDLFVGPDDCEVALLEMAYYDLLRTNRRVDKATRSEALTRYNIYRAKMKHNYGYSISKGPRKVNILR